MLPRSPSEYFRSNVWIGASFPSPREAARFHTIGIDKIMWGSDYPHNEATFPYNRESLRRSFADWTEADLRKIFATNAAHVYGFDLDKLAARAARVGPTVDEGRHHEEADLRVHQGIDQGARGGHALAVEVAHDQDGLFEVAPTVDREQPSATDRRRAGAARREQLGVAPDHAGAVGAGVEERARAGVARLDPRLGGR